MHVRSHLYTNVCWFHWLAAQVHEMEVVCSNPTPHPFLHALFFFHHSCSATAPTIGPAQSGFRCVRRTVVWRRMRPTGGKILFAARCGKLSSDRTGAAQRATEMGRPTHNASKPVLGTFQKVPWTGFFFLYHFFRFFFGFLLFFYFSFFRFCFFFIFSFFVSCFTFFFKFIFLFQNMFIVLQNVYDFLFYFLFFSSLHLKKSKI